MRWGWSSRSSPELGLRRIRKLKARKDAQDRKKSIAVKVVWQNILQALSPVLGWSVVWFCCYLSLFLINWMPLTWCTQAFKSPLHQKRFAPMLQLPTTIHWWYIIVAQLNGCTSAFSAAHCFCRLPFPLEHLCSWSTLHHLQNCTLAKSPRLDQAAASRALLRWWPPPLPAWAQLRHSPPLHCQPEQPREKAGLLGAIISFWLAVSTIFGPMEFSWQTTNGSLPCIPFVGQIEQVLLKLKSFINCWHCFRLPQQCW